MNTWCHRLLDKLLTCLCPFDRQGCSRNVAMAIIAMYLYLKVGDITLFTCRYKIVYQLPACSLVDSDTGSFPTHSDSYAHTYCWSRTHLYLKVQKMTCIRLTAHWSNTDRLVNQRILQMECMHLFIRSFVHCCFHECVAEERPKSSRSTKCQTVIQVF